MSYALDRLSQLEEEGEAPSQVAPGRQTLTSRLAPRPLDQRPRDSGEASDRLPAPVQSQMGAAFGLHLGGVSVERDSTFATSVGAEAVAHDGRLHFAPGMYDPSSTSGLSLIGHEVAHLAQQTDGRASQAQAKGEGESPELEAEAEALGSRAAAGEVGLLGDGTLRTPARSSAVQRRPTQWADINENGVGVVWDPHKTRAPGNRNQPGTATGTGSRIDAPAANIQYDPFTTSGGRGVTATNLGTQLGPGAPVGVDPAHWFNVHHLNYANVQLLPQAAGGIGSLENVIAVPPDAVHALDRIHQAIGALTHNGFVNVRIQVDELDDANAQLAYASRVQARWAQVGPNGAEVPGTTGDYVATLPSPSAVHQGTGASSLALAPVVGPNHAQSALPPAQSPGARRADAQLTTAIDFGATTADGDATRMHARALGPDHGIGEQPASGQVWGLRTKALETASGNKMKYIAGHLLNHHLGGPGNDARNLAPIPDDVNHEHEAQVEDKVKTLVRAGQWVSYEVRVAYGVDPGNGATYPSEFDCRWAQLDAAGAELPSTIQRVRLPIQPPSAYSVAPIPPKKKLPKLATSQVLHQGPDAANPIGAHTTLGFHEVLLEDTGTLGPQIRVMKPLVTALEQLGLHAEFQHNGALAGDVFHAMEAVKPSIEEVEARAEVERLTQELRDATVAGDHTDVAAMIDELRAQLDGFVQRVGARGDAARSAAEHIFEMQYVETRADEFAKLVADAAASAQRDLELTQQSTQVVIELAQQLLYQQRQLGRVNEHPMSPNQAITTNYEEAEFNAEDEPSAMSGPEAERELRRRRLNHPTATLFDPPERRRGEEALLATITTLQQGHQQWPVVDGSGLSDRAQQIGRAIEALVPGSPATDGALDMVVRSLYVTNTLAFNEYAAWLAAQIQQGPPSSQPVSDDDHGGGSLNFFDVGSPSFDGYGSPSLGGFGGGSPNLFGGFDDAPDYGGLYDPDDPFQ